MKKLCLTVFGILLLALCACQKQSAQQPPAAVDTPVAKQAQVTAPAEIENQTTEPEPQPAEEETQPTPQARPAKPEQAEDPSFLSPESDGDYDLVFFFATADIGDYEFSIAPEGSDDWQKLDEAHWLGTCGQSEEHSRVH